MTLCSKFATAANIRMSCGMRGPVHDSLTLIWETSCFPSYTLGMQQVRSANRKFLGSCELNQGIGKLVPAWIILLLKHEFADLKLRTLWTI